MKIESFELADWEAIEYALKVALSTREIDLSDLVIDLHITLDKTKHILSAFQEAEGTWGDLPSSAVFLED